ncbi:disease resistance protein RPV1 isoform X2 [Cryptomeria japonica]|uniref:disease resistance protein RPV1 isoform X2 n=1 Tax=Cryptomeria japonica TaxID=3369 RepID=UPI0027DA41A3|nr:disease resistance protein RPV1 isoform X2 [Cryptomeria japonica]
MASTSRASTSTEPSTSEESFLRYNPPALKLAFQNDKKYHVFLSFRGPDVRKTFVGHLFEALSFAGLNVFLDTEKLEKGKIIDLSLEAAIESSAIRIPIFSKGYAESTWCLREAAEMLRTPGLIIPLFYDVDPTHVRYPEKGSSPYCPSFEEHRRKSYYEKEEIDRWNDALNKICSRSGWSMDIADGFEARLVKTVVNDLINTLDRVLLQVAKHPVGVDSVKDALIHKLNLDSLNPVIKIGIWGIGGIGKTTVAKAIYNQVYTKFEATSFVSNIRTTAAESEGLIKLQKILLKDLAKYNSEVDSVDKGKSLIREHLTRKRVLLILDDVDSVKQLNALVGDWLAHGSRVIITSRDKHVINVAEVSSECIHEMSGLELKGGLELFSWYAFLRARPSPKYKDLSKRIVEACKGHPLSLEVIGSFLYDKQDETGCWEEAVHDITQNSEIYDTLYISYDALSEDEKEIFLDIACFFIGKDKALPIVFWSSLYKKVHTAISNLSMRLLIKIDGRGFFDMHDHLRDMGRNIAEKEKKGTRKWEPNDSSTVSNDLSRLQLIGGNPRRLEMLYTEGLRYLHLQDMTIQCTTMETLFLPPQSLIWLSLKNCSFEVSMELDRAVKKPRFSRQCITGWSSLELSLSPQISLPKLFDSNNNLSQLRLLVLEDLVRCHDLSSLPDSIGKLSHLQLLKLRYCPNLSSLPDTIGNLSQLQKLDLGKCFGLRSLPDTIGNLSQLQKLDLGWFMSSSLPDRIGNLSQLQKLGLSMSESLSSLPDSIGNLSQLQELDLSGRGSLSSLPNSIGNLSHLAKLDLKGCNSLSSLPDSIGKLSQLSELNLLRCNSLSSLPDSIGNLSQLNRLLYECVNLSSLPDSIGKLSQLQELDLLGCGSLSSLPNSIGNLSQLAKLDLEGCNSLSSLPDSIGKLSQLSELNLLGCNSLSSLPDSIGKLSQLQYLSLGCCNSLSSLPDSIGNLSQLAKLDLDCCNSLSSLPDSIGNLSQLQKLDLDGCNSLSSLPDSIGNLSQLQKLDLSFCDSLSILPDSIGNLSQLQELDLFGCDSLSILPDSIGNLSQLQGLDLTSCNSLSILPDSIGNLSQLISLTLCDCYNLSSLPDSIGNLSQLEELDLFHCNSLSILPDSIGNLSQLQGLNLIGCNSLSILPDSIGNLSQLISLKLCHCYNLSSLASLTALTTFYRCRTCTCKGVGA